MSEKEHPVPYSHSERYLSNKAGTPPIVTNNMVKGVSDYRREQLEREVEEGKFHAPGYKVNSNSKTTMSHVVGAKQITKNAFIGDGGADTGSITGGGAGYRGQGGTLNQTPEVYSPLLLNSNLQLPRDRATINAWSRAYFALNPIVHNAILLHSTYPISKLNIKCKDSRIRNFFEEMIEEIDLIDICTQIAQEFWLLGEAFIYAEIDESVGKWNRLLIQNPDYMVVKRSVIAGEPIISLRPDENLRRICTSNRPSDIQQRMQLDRSIVEHVRRGENIPLSNMFVSHIARKIAPYEIRGTGLPVSCFRALMLWDRLRESKYAQADDMINPLTIFKVGGGADNYKPTPADLETWRELIESATYDKNFKIISHDSIAVDVVSRGTGVYDTSNDITQLLKEIYTGLLVPQVIMDSGDITYANGGVALDVLRQRYL